MDGPMHHNLFRFAILAEAIQGFEAYLRDIEPEGRKPSALYQNPGTISLFDKISMFSFELELISAISNPKGGSRALSIRIRAR